MKESHQAHVLQKSLPITNKAVSGKLFRLKPSLIKWLHPICIKGFEKRLYNSILATPDDILVITSIRKTRSYAKKYHGKQFYLIKVLHSNGIGYIMKVQVSKLFDTLEFIKND
jgi:hypothetical protein